MILRLHIEFDNGWYLDTPFNGTFEEAQKFYYSRTFTPEQLKVTRIKLLQIHR